MPKVSLKRVLEALTSNSGAQGSTSGGGAGGKKEPDFGENLKEAQFQPCKTVRHGFPHHPTALAYDPVQKLLAIGCYSGSIRILGQPGVDCHVTHESNSAVVQLVFLTNQGALVSVCADNTIHLWNLRQKKPAILHTLKFKRESISCCNVPHQCSWIYIGSEKGNLHLCNVENFTLSGYSVSWNKAIELSQKTHPGHVVSICENPIDENKVLISFNSGFVVLWDLKNKTSELRYHCSSGIRNVCWHSEGKQFICCHDNGSLTTWNSRSNIKPIQEQFPHAKAADEACYPIDKVQWLSCRNSEPFIIFSGGLSRAMAPRPTVTVMRGRSISVLEVGYPVVDFTALISTPWACDFQDPTALVVLTDKELVVVDLERPGYPPIELGHAMDIHSSPVICLKYVPDPNTDLIPGLYKVAASRSHHDETSRKEWPISGGEWSIADCDGIPEIIVTGHADGSVRFWDASAVFLKALYKLRTKKIFKKEDENEVPDDDPFQITHLALCPESRILVTANSSSALIVFKLNSQEVQSEITTLNIPHGNEPSPANELSVDGNCHTCTGPTRTGEVKEANGPTPETETKPISNVQQPTVSRQDSAASSQGCHHHCPVLKVKSGELRQSAGFHVEFVCLLQRNENGPLSSITYMTMNTSFQLLAFGTMTSLCVVDIVQRSCLLNMSTDAMLISIDKRLQPRSPSRLKPGINEIPQSSFSFDQSTAKTPPDENLDFISKTPAEVHHSKSGVAPKKSRLNRKSLGEYFANSPLPFRRSSLFPKNPTPAPTPPLKTRHTHALFNGFTPHHLSSPEDELPSPIPEEAEPFRYEEPSTPTRLKYMMGELENGRKMLLEEKLSSDSNNADQASHSHGHASTNHRSAQREPSTSSITSGTGPAPRIKRPYRIYKKGSSCSFEKSIDSTTSADDSAFSRASSLSDAERSASKETVTFLTFSNTYTKKTDSTSSPCLWIGTSGGYFFNTVINVPSSCEERSTQFVVISPSGSLLQLKSSIVYCAFLNSTGQLISAGAGNWRDHCGAAHATVTGTADSPDPAKERSSQSPVDKQFMIVCSEKQAKVFTLPSQACIHAITYGHEMGQVVQANVDSIANGTFLVCYSTNGYIMVYGLPSLHPLLDVAYLPPNDMRVLNTFCFALNGQAMYFATPSEIQRIAFSVDTYESIQEVIGHVFIPCTSPERPNPGFFKGLFGGGHTSLDREELFGESGSGKANRSVAQLIPGTGGSSLEGLRAAPTGLAADMQRLRMQTQERGEKLGELEDRAQRMQDSAMKYSSDAHAIMLKYKNKKWYQM